MKVLSGVFCLLLIILSMTGCSNPETYQTGEAAPDSTSANIEAAEKTKLVVFAAGSLIVPFQELEQAFEKAYPDIDVQMEYHGSIQVIRRVTEIHELIDVVATADAALIPQLMFSVQDQSTGKPYADWYIRFASNEMALAYHPKSRYAAEINSQNWAEVLARPDVRLGLSDPRFDALGYRALMAFALQEELLENYELFKPMFTDQFTYPVTIFREEKQAQIHVPEILETVRGSHILMRGASIQLVALLESADIDYAFEYISVIQQHGLQILPLPDQVNLSQQDWDDFYKQVEVALDFKRFSSLQPRFVGERIGYGITIPSNAPQPEAAQDFIAFLLGDEGRAVMEKNYHPMFKQPEVNDYQALPASLQKYVIQEDGS
jgi:molybdate/tungstate transport system substrate-binding protein